MRTTRYLPRLAATLLSLCLLSTALPRTVDASQGTVLLVNMKLRDRVSDAYKRLERVVEGLAAGVDVRIVHYEMVTPAYLSKVAPKALILGPQGTPWWDYDKAKIDRFAETLQGFKGPVLGVCGGHQYLAIAYGGEVGPIDCPAKRDGYKGCKGEHGFMAVTLDAREDPLFEGLPGHIEVKESHYEEVKRLPEGFTVLASTPLSPRQVIKHKHRPLYGIQFHPEIHDTQHPHGKRLLQNFLKMAGLR